MVNPGKGLRSCEILSECGRSIHHPHRPLSMGTVWFVPAWLRWSGWPASPSGVWSLPRRDKSTLDDKLLNVWNLFDKDDKLLKARYNLCQTLCLLIRCAKPCQAQEPSTWKVQKNAVYWDKTQPTDKQRSFEPFVCLDLVLERQQPFGFQILVRHSLVPTWMTKSGLFLLSDVFAFHNECHWQWKCILSLVQIKLLNVCIFHRRVWKK